MLLLPTLLSLRRPLLLLLVLMLLLLLVVVAMVMLLLRLLAVFLVLCVLCGVLLVLLSLLGDVAVAAVVVSAVWVWKHHAHPGTSDGTVRSPPFLPHYPFLRLSLSFYSLALPLPCLLVTLSSAKSFLLFHCSFPFITTPFLC